MIHERIYPVQNQRLSPYIKHFLVLDFSDLDAPNKGVKVPPLGFPVLQFHFGEKNNFYRHRHFTSQSVFIGQCSRHITLYPAKGTKLMGVNFKPYGLFNLLGISPAAFKDSGIESRFFFSEQAINHIVGLLQENKIEAGIVAIETLLLHHQKSEIQAHHYFDTLVNRIEQENGLIDYGSLLGKTVSRRTLQRYFHEVIGLSPKLFCQILRHKFIVGLLYKNPNMTWSDLQLNGFYYDMAHFSKDFHLFSGLPPKQYLPMKNSFASTLLKLEP
jgi:AraC-like DNA-binding protein